MWMLWEMKRNKINSQKENKKGEKAKKKIEKERSLPM